MSDTKQDKYGPKPTERHYRVLVVGLDHGGALRVEHREYLSRKVYDRSGLFKYLAAEARKLDAKHSVGVTDEDGKLTILLAGKTGRFASGDLKKLVVAKLEAGGVRQTSPSAARPVKRTSRGATVKAKRTSRRAKA